jgi:hypothetical protein
MISGNFHKQQEKNLNFKSASMQTQKVATEDVDANRYCGSRSKSKQLL